MKPIKIKPVKHSKAKKQNTFCGPAAISALTGITAEAAAKKLAVKRAGKNGYGTVRKAGARRRGAAHGVAGVYTFEVLRVLRDLGYHADNIGTGSPAQRTLGQWDDARTV